MFNELDTAAKFRLSSKPVSAKGFGCGHINSTYRVECEDGSKYLLQRINDHVFPDVDGLMNNIDKVTSFLKKKIIERGGDPDRETRTVVKTLDGKNYIKEEDGTYWRVFLFIDNTTVLQVVENPIHFYYTGKAFGNFQNLLADFPAKELVETIPNFHNTISRYADFERQIKENRSGRKDSAKKEIEFAEKYKWVASELYPLIEKGELPLRVTHNDTKLNNVMLDEKTGEPVCVIDLDTVMPGLSLYDFGDSMRFGTNPSSEDEKDLSKVYCDLGLFEQYTKGFLEECGKALTKKEIELLPMSSIVMTYECGIRFLADYVDGDHYFKIDYPEQNLDRARTQFKLVADMESKLGQMKEIVEKYI